jgi:hypothetical protein
MITLTKAEALRRQALQVDHYAAAWGEAGRAAVAAHTHPEELEDDVAYPVHIVHRAIPMGGRIESIIIDLGLKPGGGFFADRRTR